MPTAQTALMTVSSRCRAQMLTRPMISAEISAAPGPVHGVGTSASPLRAGIEAAPMPPARSAKWPGDVGDPPRDDV